jgi:hypothetical protein
MRRHSNLGLKQNELLPVNPLSEITTLNHCILGETEQAGPPSPNDQPHCLHFRKTKYCIC